MPTWPASITLDLITKLYGYIHQCITRYGRHGILQISKANNDDDDFVVYPEVREATSKQIKKLFPCLLAAILCTDWCSRQSILRVKEHPLITSRKNGSFSTFLLPPTSHFWYRTLTFCMGRHTFLNHPPFFTLKVWRNVWAFPNGTGWSIFVVRSTINEFGKHSRIVLSLACRHYHGGK